LLASIILTFLITAILFLIIALLIFLYNKRQSKKAVEIPEIINRNLKLIDRAWKVFVGLGTILGIASFTLMFFQPPLQEQDIIIPFTLSAHYRTIPITATDRNAVIYATTSIEVDRVELQGVRNRELQGTWDMQSNNSKNWTFNANFYQAGAYQVTVTAFGFNGETISYSFEVIYPGDWLLNLLN